jgi:hypothetical protein
MQTITIPRQKLLEKLTTNREQHVKEYGKALLGYQQAALKEVRMQVEKLEEDPSHRMVLTEVKPISHESSYGRAIRMLEWSVDENVTLTGNDFSRFVDDDWEWREDWSTSNAKYLGRR